MKFLDANILAYAFYANEFQLASQKALRQSSMTDTLALIEAFNIIEKQTNREYALESLRSILRSDIEIVTIDVNIFFETLKIAKGNEKLSIYDLTHYFNALTKNCESILTYDKDFDHLSIEREEPKL